ncbi:LpqB family beta-propeller domain-containing protein [Kineosporia sp. A_224]|uniref:LpqB family beta-propeller domain-containing protein n=1 Tax=Kineosporia sp. A_224 TaxID=1962180 RepID=UPI000B4B0CA9|nr:LpqB family beta-propeller domain-containing protein [Kineosporia sp. A_224]
MADPGAAARRRESRPAGRPGDVVLGRRAALTGLLAAGAALAGCARIPTEGPIATSTDLAVEDLGRAIPLPPRPGSTPDAIVDGFLRAAAIGSSDITTARAFLAENVRWDPDGEVVLYTTSEVALVRGPGAAPDDPPTGQARATPSAAPRPRDGDRAEVAVRLDGVVATLDRVGRLSPLPAQVRRLAYGLVVREGEWRIDRLVDGLPVSLSQFDTSSGHAPTALYFPDPSGRWLVPDVRYLRERVGATQTQVVTALLDGPSGWLAGAVTVPRTPGPLRLRVSSVPPPVAGVATVDLDESALALDEQAQALLREQLFRSMSEANGTAVVTKVEISVDGQLLPGAGGAGQTPGAASLPRTADQALVGATFVAVDAKARILLGQGSTPPRPVAGLQLAGGARPAMSYTDAPRTYALVVTGKDQSVRTLKVAEGTTPPLDVVAAADLTSPSFDSSGWVWASPRRPAGSVVAAILVSGRVRRVDVAAPWLRSGQVVALRVSREGARAVLVVDDVAADGRRASRLLLCGVRRRQSGEPVSLGGPVRLLPDLVRAADVAWSGAGRVTVLGSRRRTDKRLLVQPWTVDVGGDPSPRGTTGTADLGAILTGADGKQVTSAAVWERLAPEVAPTLAVGDTADDVYVGTAKGDLFHYRQTGSWERSRAGVFRPAFPG